MLPCTRVLQNTAHKQLAAAHSFTTLNNTRVPSLQFSRPRQLWVAIKFKISKAAGHFNKKKFCDEITTAEFANINNLTRMFATNEKKSEYKLAPIAMIWNNKFVKNISEVSFGYKNFNRVFTK